MAGFRLYGFSPSDRHVTDKMASFTGSVMLCLIIISFPAHLSFSLAKERNPFSRVVLGNVEDGMNGGKTCAGCGIVVGLVEQLAVIYNASVSEALEMLCSFLPGGFRVACDALVEEYGPAVIKLLEAAETPDIVCYGIGLCKKETKEICHLFPLPKAYMKPAVLDYVIDDAIRHAQAVKGRAFTFPDLCKLPLVDEICKIIDRFDNDHLPIDDVDGDRFSDLPTFRGTSWRGKDCVDFDAEVYPGRYSTDDAVIDSNCNGVYGVEPASAMTYESLWCKGTKQMGSVLLGDSAGAHFHIPPQYLTSRDLSVDVFKDLFFILENEFDWPMLSSSTAFTNVTWKDISGPVNSTYEIFRRINRCNHRDYQNIGVNGARSSSMADNIVKSFARNAALDNPVFILLELLGNDVCNPYHDTSHMTTPEEFASNILTILKYLDTKVPPGSVLVAFGLAQGTVLYDSLYNRTHPIGSLRNDVTYADVYDYLNCLYVSPCFGWMNSNATWRNITQKRADELSATMREVITKFNFKNFEAYYLDAPFDEIFALWEKRGGEPWQLIEPVDGFHPNQKANALAAEVTWDIIQQKFPGVLPPTNPHNDAIEKRFGDQGGY